MRFEPAGFTGNGEIPIAKSIVDYVFRWMGSRFMGADERDALGLIGERPASVLTPAPFAHAPLGTPSSGATSSGAAEGAPNSLPAEGTTADGGSASAIAPSPLGEEDGGTLRPTAVATATSDGSGAASTILPVVATNGHVNGNGHAKAASNPLSASLGATTRVAFSVSADSPSCADCGSIMVRNGSCYKCLNCGSTSGCS